MSNKPLRGTLQSLQCHFTWHFEVKDKVDVVHILKTLALQVEHTVYPNRSTYIAMKAYLHYLQGHYDKALHSLREAEEVLRQDHLTSFSRQALVAYGNYAWIYYHLNNYHMVELYLGRIHEICQSLSSSEPYSVLIPEIHAQKGWCLLAGGFRNGMEATECFRMALEGDASNEEYQAGLAFSVFASWTHSWSDFDKAEAQRLLGEVTDCQSQNAEAKVYLARLLQYTDLERARRLAEDAVQNSRNPEVLRIAAKVYQTQSLSQAISILKQGIDLAPSYHLLHYDLGLCYMKLMETAPPEEREEMVAAAIKSFKLCLEADPPSVFARLKLAKMYGERSPAYEEEIYLNLMEELPSLSKRCQQAVYLHWGDFLLHKKGLTHMTLEMYKACFRVPGDHPAEWKQLLIRLRELARRFQEDFEVDQAEAVYSLLQEMRFKGPGHNRGRGLHSTGAVL
ncbi:interferon-induced protein with tetratricopeptide repeats 5-like [Elgaria multicarinata webbii]|uniref:interferon-induced protein with tetratricopeptide repeats 5-like n=1 Tax=Elgaria multicarinata webbii TaxID=159646 RepID=UPI002FCCF62D